MRISDWSSDVCSSELVEGRGAARKLRRRLGLDAVGVEEFLQLAGLEHLANDVAAADELALHVELRDGRPVAEVLDALADAGVLQHVDAFELHIEVREDLDDGGREAALREHR